jgi:Nif-specific regulatory protein
MSENGAIDREAITLSGIDETATISPARKSEVPLSAELDDPGLDERERLIAALEQAGWVQAKAARLLNMTPRQIAYRIQTLNIKVRRI